MSCCFLNAFKNKVVLATVYPSRIWLVSPTIHIAISQKGIFKFKAQFSFVTVNFAKHARISK